MNINADLRDCDWKIDFLNENGNYQNKCLKCSVIFVGNKGRIECKQCYLERVAKELKENPSPIKISTSEGPQFNQHLESCPKIRDAMGVFIRTAIGSVCEFVEECAPGECTVQHAERLEAAARTIREKSRSL